MRLRAQLGSLRGQRRGAAPQRGHWLGLRSAVVPLSLNVRRGARRVGVRRPAIAVVSETLHRAVKCFAINFFQRSTILDSGIPTAATAYSQLLLLLLLVTSHQFLAAIGAIALSMLLATAQRRGTRVTFGLGLIVLCAGSAQ